MGRWCGRHAGDEGTCAWLSAARAVMACLSTPLPLPAYMYCPAQVSGQRAAQPGGGGRQLLPCPLRRRAVGCGGELPAAAVQLTELAPGSCGAVAARPPSTRVCLRPRRTQEGEGALPAAWKAQVAAGKWEEIEALVDALLRCGPGRGRYVQARRQDCCACLLGCRPCSCCSRHESGALPPLPMQPPRRMRRWAAADAPKLRLSWPTRRQYMAPVHNPKGLMLHFPVDQTTAVEEQSPS